MSAVEDRDFTTGVLGFFVRIPGGGRGNRSTLRLSENETSFDSTRRKIFVEDARRLRRKILLVIRYRYHGVQ